MLYPSLKPVVTGKFIEEYTRSFNKEINMILLYHIKLLVYYQVENGINCFL